MKNGLVTNDREPIGTTGVGCLEQSPAGAPCGIINVHVHLANDDILFASQLVGGEAGVLHDVSKDRSEERRVGEECRSRWSPDHLKKNKSQNHAIIRAAVQEQMQVAFEWRADFL